MTSDEIEFLIVQRLDGTLSSDESAQLTAALGASAEARSLLATHERLHVALRRTSQVPRVDGEWMVAQVAAALDDAEEIARSNYRLPRWALFGPIAAAASLFIVLTLGVVFHKDDDQPVSMMPRPEKPIARVAVAVAPLTSTPHVAAVSVGAPANLSPSLVTALFVAEQLPGAGRVIVRPGSDVSPGSSTFE